MGIVETLLDTAATAGFVRKETVVNERIPRSDEVDRMFKKYPEAHEAADATVAMCNIAMDTLDKTVPRNIENFELPRQLFADGAVDPARTDYDLAA